MKPLQIQIYATRGKYGNHIFRYMFSSVYTSYLMQGMPSAFTLSCQQTWMCIFSVSGVLVLTLRGTW